MQDIYAERNKLVTRVRGLFGNASGNTYEEQQRLEKELSEYNEAVEAEFEANKELEELKSELYEVLREVGRLVLELFRRLIHGQRLQC